MTHLDHRKPPARTTRRKQSTARPSSHGSSRRSAGRDASNGSASDGSGSGRTGAGRKRVKRSHSAIGAAVVAGTAMVAAFAFILTNGNSSNTDDDSIRIGSVPQASAPAAQPKANPAPSTGSGKADRKPPSNKPAAGKSSKPPAAKTSQPVAPPNTGTQSPTFRRGQWIAIVDSYPTDAGMAADQLARSMAAKMIAAGIPAKALLASGQYPGLRNSSFEPVTNTWIVYIGPATTADAANALCVSPKAQKAYGNLLACPTYEPATAHN